MKTKSILNLISFLVIILISSSSAQTFLIKGKVIDAEEKTAIENVNVIVQGSEVSTTTNTSGEFKLNLSRGTVWIELSHVSYRSKTISITPDGKSSDSVLTIYLQKGNIKLGNVYIVSTKYSHRYDETPLPLEVITGSEINRYKPLTVPDIISTKPGISLQRDGIWATSVSVRGLKGADVITLIDGNRIETATDLDGAMSLFDMDNIRQVEVIKNASSVLYGTGALGGIINIITKGGHFTNGLSVRGNVNSGINSVNRGLSNGAGLNLSSRNWTLDLNGSYRKAGNTSTPTGELQNSGYNDDYFSGSLGYFINDNNRIKVSYQNFKGWDIGIPGGSGLFPLNAQVKYSFIKRDMFDLQYSVKNLIAPLKDLTVKFFNQNIYRFVDNVPNMTVVVQGTNGKPDQVVNVAKISPSARHYVTGVQLQSNWLFGRNLLLAGVDAWQRNLDSRREKYIIHSAKDQQSGVLTREFTETIGEKPLPDASFRSIGIYAQDEIPLFGERLKVTLGARADKIIVKNDQVSNPVYYFTTPAGMKNPPQTVLNWNAMEENDYSWSGNLNVLYNLSKELKLTFSYSRSFRAASLEERYKYIDLGSLVKLGNPLLKPEKGNYLDAGFRFNNKELRASGNIFINYLADQIIETPGTFEGRSAYLSVNAGRSRLYGFDGSAAVSVSENSDLTLCAAYVRGEDLSGNTNLPEIPPLNGRIGYRVSVPEVISCELVMNIFSSQEKTAPGELATPGYVYYSLYLSSSTLRLMGSHLRIFAGCENIFDKSYRNHISTIRGLILNEPGRNIFLKLSLGFGEDN